MFHVGSLNPAGSGGVVSAVPPPRKHQTHIFWDYESIHPSSPKMTAVQLYRKLKEYLKEKGVTPGVEHCNVYALPSPANRTDLEELYDLGLNVLRGTSSRVALHSDMSASLSNIRTTSSTENVNVVVITREKCFGKNIKELSDNDFHVYVIHDFVAGSSAADILEMYATRWFAMSDILGPMLLTTSASSGSGGASLADSQHSTTTTTTKVQHVQGRTVLIEGRRVSLDDLEVTSAVRDILDNPTSLGMRWCANLAPHDIQTCKQAHRSSTPSTAVVTHSSVGSGSVSSPPPYSQTVKSPMVGPATTHSGGGVVSAPPPPAGTSPIMVFHSVPGVPGAHHHPLFHHPSQHVAHQQQHHHHNHPLPPQHSYLPLHQQRGGGVQHVITTPGAHFPSSHHHHFLGPAALPPPSIPVHHRGGVNSHPVAPPVAAVSSHAAAPILAPPPATMSLWNDVVDVPPHHAVHSGAAPFTVVPTTTTPELRSTSDDNTSHVAQMEALLSTLTNPTAASVGPGVVHTTAQQLHPHQHPNVIGQHHQQQQQLDFFSLLGPSCGAGNSTAEQQVAPRNFGSGLLADSDDGDDDEVEDENMVAPLSVAHTTTATAKVKTTSAVGKQVAPHNSSLKAPSNTSSASPQAPAPVSVASPVQDTPKKKATQDTPALTTVWGSKQESTHTADADDDREDLPTLESLGAPASTTTGLAAAKTAAVARKNAGGSAALGAAAAAAGKSGSGKMPVSFASIVGTSKPVATTTTVAPVAVKKPAQRPREFILDGHTVSIDLLVKNKFIDNCYRDGTNVGRFCADHRAHSMMDCVNAHRDKYALLQGGEVDGKVLLTNKALENLRANTTYKGNFCTSPKPHDPLKCTYLHRKPGH